MRGVVIGLLAVAAGAALCFRGYLAMRIIIPIWGGFAGFVLGAGLVAGIGDRDFLRSLAAWLVGIAVGVVFAAVAYLYFEVSVAIAMAAIGFTLGTAVMVALGVQWSWVIVLVGVVSGLALAMLTIAFDLPMLLLVVLTALAGATTVVGGIMLIADVVDSDDFDVVTTTETIDDSWWWYAIYVAVAVVGVVAQLADIDLRRSARQAWRDGGGRELRRT